MRYSVSLGERTFEVEVDGRDIRLDGRPVEARLLRQAGGLARLQVDGASRLLALVETERGWTVHLAGESWRASVLDDRTKRIQAMTSETASETRSEVIRAPMPGLVLRLEVEEGARIAPGAGLLVLEAMKMENEIRSVAGGVVTRVLVTPGSPVEKGAPLLEIGPGE